LVSALSLFLCNLKPKILSKILEHKGYHKAKVLSIEEVLLNTLSNESTKHYFSEDTIPYLYSSYLKIKTFLK
jgi:hypothetical protein